MSYLEEVSELLKELPPDTVVWRAMMSGGVFTAERLIKEIEDETDLGKQYSSDMLRVARDFLSRQAIKKDTRHD